MGCSSSDLHENNKYLTKTEDYYKSITQIQTVCGICHQQKCECWTIIETRKDEHVQLDIKCSCNKSKQFSGDTKNPVVCSFCLATRVLKHSDPRKINIGTKNLSIVTVNSVLTINCTKCENGYVYKTCNTCHGIFMRGKMICTKCVLGRIKVECDNCLNMTCKQYLRSSFIN